MAEHVNILNTFDRLIGRAMVGLHHLARAGADPHANAHKNCLCMLNIPRGPKFSELALSLGPLLHISPFHYI